MKFCMLRNVIAIGLVLSLSISQSVRTSECSIAGFEQCQRSGGACCCQAMSGGCCGMECCQSREMPPGEPRRSPSPVEPQQDSLIAVHAATAATYNGSGLGPVNGMMALPAAASTSASLQSLHIRINA